MYIVMSSNPVFTKIWDLQRDGPDLTLPVERDVKPHPMGQVT